MLIVVLSLLVVWALTASCLFWAASLLPRAGHDRDAVVVVLGGGVRDGALTALGRARVAAGVTAAGGTRRIVFTGGLSNGASEASLMGPEAVRLGVAPERIIEEGKSRTTLQNALFCHDILGGGPVVLASDRFHLPRAALLFRWAGFEIAGFAPSGHVPRGGALLWFIARDALSLWLNLGRILAWRGTALLGWSRETRIKRLT